MRKISSLLVLTGFANVVLAAGCGDDGDAGGTSGSSAKGGTSGSSAKGGTSGGSARGGSSGRGGVAGHAGVSGSGGSSGTGGSAAQGGSSGKGTRGGSSQGGSAGSSSGEAGVEAVAGANEAGSGGSAGTTEAGAGGGGGEAGSYDPACAAVDPEATVTSHLIVTADNEAVVYVNGTNVGTTSNWSVAVTIDVSLHLYPGRENVVAIVGTNTSSQAGNDRGIVGQLTVESSSGSVPILVTDATWRVSTTEVTGWSAPSFDDSSWIFASELGTVGMSPWGNVIPGSSAKWIWSAQVPESTSDKPNLESTYARRKFYLGLDGITTSPTPSCPKY